MCPSYAEGHSSQGVASFGAETFRGHHGQTRALLCALPSWSSWRFRRSQGALGFLGTEVFIMGCPAVPALEAKKSGGPK